VVEDSVGVRFVESCDPLVFGEYGAVDFLQDAAVLTGPAKRHNLTVLVIVEHRNVHLAPPTPNDPHARPRLILTRHVAHVPSFGQNRSDRLRERQDAIACGALSCSEMRLLFTVTEAFTVAGRGVVLLPELNFVGEEKFRVGESLRLRFADGAEELVQIGGLEFLCPLHGKCQLVMMLSGKSKEDIPIGTEVWGIEKSAV